MLANTYNSLFVFHYSRNKKHDGWYNKLLLQERGAKLWIPTIKWIFTGDRFAHDHD